jgi:hypothetical protein
LRQMLADLRITYVEAAKAQAGPVGQGGTGAGANTEDPAPAAEPGD